MRAALALSVFLCACSEQGLTVHNKAPEVALLSPVSGQELPADQAFEMVAQITDPETDLEEMTLIWSSEGGELTGNTRFKDGNALFTVADGLSRGSHILSVKAVDGGGDTDSDTVNVEMFSGNPPRITWNSPQEGKQYAFGFALLLDITFIDTDEDDLTDLQLEWGGVASFFTNLPDHPEPDGGVDLYLPGIPAGRNQMTITATDTSGFVTVSQVRFEMVDGDLDGDGQPDIKYGGTDCDDTDIQVFLGAQETCNGIDDDCDGVVDDNPNDAVTYYLDDDGDGYGDPFAPMDFCAGTAPSNYLSDDQDCDDTDASIKPGGNETDDGVDEDCDGDRIERGLFDGDNDGYTDLYGAQGDPRPDCDDNANDVNPGASEQCDATDNDCDNTIDEGGCSCAVVQRQGSPYLFCDTPSTWLDARDACYSWGYKMVSIANQSENDWVDDEVDNYTSAEWWIGLNDRSTEGDWVWEDGSSVTYTAWHTCPPTGCQPDGDEPNNLGNEDCAELNYWTDGTWNDRDCSLLHGFVCELP